MLADSGMQQLIDIAVSTRRFIEPVWHDWHRARDGEIPGVASRHTCARTSLFLVPVCSPCQSVPRASLFPVNVLHREGLPAEWMSGTPHLSDEGPDLGPFGFSSMEAGRATLGCAAAIGSWTSPPISSAQLPSSSRRHAIRAMALARAIRPSPEFIAARRRAVDALWPVWLARCWSH